MANAFFLRYKGVLSFMQGDLGKPRFLLLFINGNCEAFLNTIENINSNEKRRRPAADEAKIITFSTERSS